MADATTRIRVYKKPDGTIYAIQQSDTEAAAWQKANPNDIVVR